MARLGVLLGKFHSEPDTIAADARLMLADVGPAHTRGRDMARACVECHGAELKGGGFTGAPDLTIAAAYDDADFERLMRTGVAAGNRKVGLMSEIAPDRFGAWSSEEIAALHGYLKARAQRQIAQASNRASEPALTLAANDGATLLNGGELCQHRHSQPARPDWPEEKRDLGGSMRRQLAFTGAARTRSGRLRSIACLVFVAILGAAFWAGAAFIAENILRSAPGF